MLQTFIESPAWDAMRAVLGSDMDTHEQAMFDAVGRSHLHCEGAYEAGCYRTLKYVQEDMLPMAIEYLKTGAVPGVIESSEEDAPEQKDEEEVDANT